MRSSNSAVLALALLAGCSGGTGEMLAPSPATSRASVAAPVPLPPGTGDLRGPAATAGSSAPSRYDQVGYASWYGEERSGASTASGTPFAPDAITAAHRTLPLGSYAEVTALDTGRTILVLVNDRGPSRTDREIDLSRGAAALLGTGNRAIAPVRVRSVVATAGDAAALSSGRPAGRRLDAPPALLAALRRNLAQRPPVAVAPVTKPVPIARTALVTKAPALASSRAAPRVGQVVQVAAFSTQARARDLAKTLRGYVEPAGNLFRVRLGPFSTVAEAQRARDAAVRRGYGDATIIVQP